MRKVNELQFLFEAACDRREMRKQKAQACARRRGGAGKGEAASGELSDGSAEGKEVGS